MKTNKLKRFNQLVGNEKSGWLEKAIWKEKNEAWLEKSAKIGIRILREIRKQKPINGMSQKMLADQMGVSAQYINKLVKGQENLTLETIAKIEGILGISLISVDLPSSIQLKADKPIERTVKVKSNQSVHIGYSRTNAQSYAFFAAEPQATYTTQNTYGNY